MGSTLEQGTQRVEEIGEQEDNAIFLLSCLPFTHRIHNAIAVSRLYCIKWFQKSSCYQGLLVCDENDILY